MLLTNVNLLLDARSDRMVANVVRMLIDVTTVVGR